MSTTERPEWADVAAADESPASDEEVVAHIAARYAALCGDGFLPVAEHGGLRAGTRVHHVGERYLAAERLGTGTVVHVLRKGTDDNPDRWERQYGRPNIEILVRLDKPRIGRMPVGEWADYHAVIVKADAA